MTSDDRKIHDDRSNKGVIDDKEILDNKPFCFCCASSVPPNNSVYDYEREHATNDGRNYIKLATECTA